MVKLKVTRTITETLEWDELLDNIRRGNVRKGDNLSILFDGNETQFDVIAVDDEEIVGKNFAHSITIVMHDPIEPQPFDKNRRNIWESSSLRKYLNSEEFKKRFDDNLISHLAIVTKDNDTDGKTEDMFYLLSYDEYCRLLPSNYHGWLRSANRGNAYFVWNVNSTGDVHYASACYERRCTPVCVIVA